MKNITNFHYFHYWNVPKYVALNLGEVINEYAFHGVVIFFAKVCCKIWMMPTWYVSYRYVIAFMIFLKLLVYVPRSSSIIVLCNIIQTYIIHLIVSMCHTYSDSTYIISSFFIECWIWFWVRWLFFFKAF